MRLVLLCVNGTVVHEAVGQDEATKKTESLYHGHRLPASIYPATRAEIRERADVKHVFVKACARLISRALEAAISPHVNACGAYAFRLPDRTQTFLSCFGPTRQHFAFKRHLPPVLLYDKQHSAQFEAWQILTNIARNPPIVCRTVDPPTPLHLLIGKLPMP